MRFRLDDEHRAFARSLDGLLTASGTPRIIRAWAAGDHAPGLALWKELAQADVLALAVPARQGGLGLRPLELVVAFTELGRHAAPGPWVETVAGAALIQYLGGPDGRRDSYGDAYGHEGSGHRESLGDTDGCNGPAGLGGGLEDRLSRIASGEELLSLPPPGSPYALDADAADTVLLVERDTVRLATGHGPVQRSQDPARRLARPTGGPVLARGPAVAGAAAHANGIATLMTAAMSLGLGRALLDRTVAHVEQRAQFGAPIGSYQAVKHRLADTVLALEFAEPLLHAAALTLRGPDVAAAKVTACEAAYGAARTALQLHGALGYTDEFPLSLWLRKARPLRDAWGTPSECRARVLA